MAQQTAEQYERHVATVREANRKKTEAGQEIAPMPEVVNTRRKNKARKSFAYFCKTYFAEAFYLPWSEYHLSAADKIERASRSGGLFSFAMPRGSGKTTICEWAALWGTLFGISPYVVLIGATEDDAESRLKNIKTELMVNDLLLEDFPEVCHPVRRIGNAVRRAEGQKYNGVLTGSEWKAKMFVLPTIEGSAASGGIIEVRGITGKIRGMNHKTRSGEIRRPTLAICDDPQTRESAGSLTQCKKRSDVIMGDVAYLAGPKRAIAVVMPCTVIYRGDLADRMLDREACPDWQGEKTKMMPTFPTNMGMWLKYRETQITAFQNDDPTHPETAFYKENLTEMRLGATVSWIHRYDESEVDAIQHSMNKYFRDPSIFQAECQNDPEAVSESEPELTDEDIIAKSIGIERGRIPLKCTKITAFIDVQKEVLYWIVVAWEPHFSGHIVAYGAFPDQQMEYYANNNLRNKLSDMTPGAGMEGAIYAGLVALCNDLVTRMWVREDGVELAIDTTLIDANWGQSTSVVYKVCGSNAWRGTVMPSHGKYVGASSQPWADLKGRRGETMGHHWRRGKSESTHLERVVIDTNYWKSFVYDRLAVPIGDSGTMTIHQGTHRLLAEHLNSEFRVRTKGRGRELDEWKARPDRLDNHWFDCLVGAAVAASMQNLTMARTVSEGKRDTSKTYKSLSALQKQKRRDRR